MSGLIALGVFTVLVLLGVFCVWLSLREPKTPDRQLRSHPDYRALVTFIHKVAYWNDTSPGWTVENIVPPELVIEAQKLLAKEKKELRSQ